MTCNVCHRPESEHKSGLLCCPFCGSDYVLRVLVGAATKIRCFSCHMETPTLLEQSPTQPADIWNRRASGWIACAERMPKRGALLLFCADRGVYEGHRDESGQGWQFRYGWLADNVVTHWMPLPAPPEVEP